jgi:hypothetical protein
MLCCFGKTGYNSGIKAWCDPDVIGENIAYFQVGLTFDMRA